MTFKTRINNINKALKVKEETGKGVPILNFPQELIEKYGLNIDGVIPIMGGRSTYHEDEL